MYAYNSILSQSNTCEKKSNLEKKVDEPKIFFKMHAVKLSHYFWDLPAIIRGNEFFLNCFPLLKDS